MYLLFPTVCICGACDKHLHTPHVLTLVLMSCVLLLPSTPAAPLPMYVQQAGASKVIGQLAANPGLAQELIEVRAGKHADGGCVHCLGLLVPSCSVHIHTLIFIDGCDACSAYLTMYKMDAVQADMVHTPNVTLKLEWVTATSQPAHRKCSGIVRMYVS